jgi:catechol 2,3-dioxygenase-like lactoylglutathione lyase family enzyme
MFKRIDHVEIVTDRLDRTVQFYTDVLGFTVKARDRIQQSGLGVPIDLVYLDLGGTVVELISYEGVSVDPAPELLRFVDRDRGAPRGATPPTPPGIRVTYHGGSTGLSLVRNIESGETERVEVVVAQGLLDRRVS